MKKALAALCLTCVFAAAPICAGTAGRGGIKDLNAPVPETAKKLVAGTRGLIERDRFREAEAALKKAISLAPGYVNAHAEYIELKANFLNRFDEVYKEYQDLMKKEPGNPAYPMALALALSQTSQAVKNGWLQKAVEAAPPGWAWSHYARALLAVEKEPETAVAELKKYIEADGSWRSAYYTLAYVEGTTLKRLDDAVRTAEKMAARPDSRPWDLSHFWRLRLGRAGGTPAAKDELRRELGRLLASSADVKTLDAVRLGYGDLLGDKEGEARAEKKIRRLDPAWYPERGRFIYIATRSVSGVSRRLIAPNRQFVNFNKINEFNGEIEPERKIMEMTRLLASLRLSPELRHYVREQIFKAADKARDARAMVTHGDRLFAADPADAAIPSKIAVALADKKDAPGALRYALLADRATAVFRPLARPANGGQTDAEWDRQFPEGQQRKFHQRMRALALDALGWAHYAAGNFAAGEQVLRRSVELNRTERNLLHLSRVLRAAGRGAEAEAVAKEAADFYANALKQSFRDEPAKDFELATLDGRKVRLSELKGKVVLIDFWATWCGPCVKSLPTLAAMYEKYKDRGLEILYISGDAEADKYKVAPFARERKLPFQVMHDAAQVQQTYNVKSFPTTIFIDRQGKVRHRDVGFTSDESPRMIETVIEILLQAK